MSAIPEFLQFKPKPDPVIRLYHGRHVQLWRGCVRLSDVRGWADNPRLRSEIKRWKSEFNDAEPTQEQLYEIMKRSKEKHIRLKGLSDNIRDNGLREPIVLTFDGRLLDGNRRFFATKLAHETAQDPAKKRELETIPVFVVTEDATDESLHSILVEENFTSSYKEEWPDYVKAQYIWEAYDSRSRDSRARKLDKTDKEIAKEVGAEFGWDRRKVEETLRIWGLMENFIDFAATEPDLESERGGLGLSPLEAEKVASDNYQFFNEAQKSFLDPLRKNPEFAALFYELINRGDFFKSFPEVRCAHKGYMDKERCLPIMEGAQPGGGKDVRLRVQLTERQIKASEGVRGTIEEFVDFLNKLTTAQKSEISGDTLDKLREALSLVEGMVETARTDK